MSNPVITRLEEQRAAQVEFIDQTLSRVDAEERDLVQAEQDNLSAARERIAQIDAQLEPLREFEQLRGAHRSTGASFSSTGTGGQTSGGQSLAINTREHEYRTAGEFLADGYRAAQKNDEGARARLQSTGVVLEGGQLIRASAPHTTTAEVPGLLPVTIQGQVMSDLDAARPFISSVGAKDLGGIPGTSFKRPVVTEHVKVAKQSAQKAEVEDGQFKVGTVDFAKDTYGGWTNVSRQAIDWTSPAVWDALMTDFMEVYSIETENAAADAFATAVTQTQELTSDVGEDPTLAELLGGLYGAASKAYAGSGRLPDTIWASLDWWVKLGVLIDHLQATTAGNGGGNSSLTSFTGNLLQTNRVIVPSFPAGTLIVGVKSRTEVYEDRFGFLTAVQPKVFGVELAYGGYMASGTIKPAAFAKLVNAS